MDVFANASARHVIRMSPRDLSRCHCCVTPNVLRRGAYQGKRPIHGERRGAPSHHFSVGTTMPLMMVRWAKMKMMRVGMLAMTTEA